MSTTQTDAAPPLKISTINAASLRAAWGKGLHDWALASKPDVICIQETKMHETSQPNIGAFLLDGYQGYFFDCNKPGFHGTAIYTKIKPISVKESFPDDEGRSITMEFSNFYLVNSYVPNAGQKLEKLTYKIETWNPHLKEYLDELSKTKAVIWTGDLNVAHEEIDIFDPKGKDKTAGYTPQEREWFHKFLESGYTDIFRKRYPDKKEFSFYTYRGQAKAKGNGWRLDYFIMDNAHYKDELVNDCAMETGDFSDHVPVSLFLDRSLLAAEDVAVDKTFNKRLNNDTIVDTPEVVPEKAKPKKGKKDQPTEEEPKEEEAKEEAKEEPKKEESEEKPKPKPKKGKQAKEEESKPAEEAKPVTEEAKPASEESKPAEEAKPAEEEKPKAAKPKKTKKVVEEEPQEPEDEVDDEEEEEEKPKKKRRGKKGEEQSLKRMQTREKRKTIYFSDDDSDDSTEYTGTPRKTRRSKK